MVKKQQILKEIRDRMFNITRDNGYFHDIKKVEISRQEIFQSTEVPAINVHYRSDDPNFDNYGSGERLMRIMVGGFSTTNKKDLDAAEITFQLEEDIIMSLNRSNDLPQKTSIPSICLGGIVKEITNHSSTPINQGRLSPFIGVLIEFEVRYLLDGETLS